MSKRDFDTVSAGAPPYPAEIEDRPMLGVCPDCGHNWRTSVRRLRATTRCPKCRHAFHTVHVMAAKAEGIERDMRDQEKADRAPVIFVPGSATGQRKAGFAETVKGKLRLQ